MTHDSLTHFHLWLRHQCELQQNDLKTKTSLPETTTEVKTIELEIKKIQTGLTTGT